MYRAAFMLGLVAGAVVSMTAGVLGQPMSWPQRAVFLVANALAAAEAALAPGKGSESL